jgi:plastocyanin
VKPFLLTAVTAVVVVPVAAGVSSSVAGDKRATVRVMDNFFDPRSKTIDKGSKVTFVWKGTNKHNVRFTKVPSGARKKGARTRRDGEWSRHFNRPGLYRYVCTLFDGMRGTIRVRKPPPESSESSQTGSEGSATSSFAVR